MNCARTACRADLTDKHVAIWNEPSSDQPRLYCVPCGTKIVRGNRQDTIKLKHELRENLNA